MAENRNKTLKSFQPLPAARVRSDHKIHGEHWDLRAFLAVT
jgi:hypothetical protein